MQIESVCDRVASVKAEISRIFYTKVLTKALNTIISNSQSRRSNPVILKFGTAHRPVIIFHWTKNKLESRLKILQNFQSKRLTLKVPAVRALAA